MTTSPEAKHAHLPAQPDPTKVQHRGARARLVAGLLLCCILAGLALWWYLGRAPTAPAQAAAVEVEVTQAVARPMPVVLQSVGTVVAQSSVEVRAQVSGVLRQVFVEDGQRVERGQKLFALDAQPLNAALAQAQAQWARDQALADDAAAARARLQPLAEKEYVTAREYEAAVNSQRSLQASATATRTQIDQARISLAYSTIRSPIAGRVGAVQFKPGSLVTEAGATPLVVVTASSPVEMSFTLPQADAHRLREAVREAGPGKRLPAEARDSATQALRAQGELVFIDNTLDASAGTVTLKARFTNTDEALWPGEFYAVRVKLRTDQAAVTLPERALQQGQSGPYVYVAAGGKARMRAVKVDRVLDGDVVIASGVAVGETVLTTIPGNLRNGSDVRLASDRSRAGGAASSPDSPTRVPTPSAATPASATRSGA